ncbi:MAG: hypothetical protein ACI37Z_01775 [Candidatus Gastranaerophilaceae bacterium]
MRIQAITACYTDRQSLVQNNVATENFQPVKHLLQNENQSIAKANFGWIKNLFSSPLSQKMQKVKNITDENGSKRYDKADLKAIKKYLKNDEISVDVLQDFAVTNLDVKGMSEAYLFAKESKNPNCEQKNILNAVTEFEKFENNSLKKQEYQTQLERKDDGKYEIKNYDYSHRATYKVDGEKIGECTVTVNPDYLPKNSSDESEIKDNKKEEEEEKNPFNNPFRPYNPRNPFNYFDPFIF